MKMNQKDSEKVGWDQMSVGSQNRAMPKLMVWLFLFVSVTYVVYTLKLLSSSSYRGCDDGDLLFSTTHNRLSLPQSQPNSTASQPQTPNFPAETTPFKTRAQTRQNHHKTELKHVVFGIAASAKLWDHRKNYIKLWWKPKHMRGVVWVDSPVKTRPGEGLPRVKVSSDTSRFAYTNRQGHRSAIRISRIVSETFRLGIEDVRWFVMGDDDTVFVTENLIRVLSKYDHNQYYYIGSLSESHLQNIYFSYSMAYGGGGFAISYPLAKALERMQDRCIQRYPGLFASDDRMQACMAELGVPLTKELGFHQVGWWWFCAFFVLGIWLFAATESTRYPTRNSVSAGCVGGVLWFLLDWVFALCVTESTRGPIQTGFASLCCVGVLPFVPLSQLGVSLGTRFYSVPHAN
ncbi:transferring glycosyl group transferase [Actinidia rufa]|uniref:Transferring glycosyl group transferase n=1 Tax=Actinidia rufa TaxID=165716 RepID=A0A7J0G7D0_9ERIC|nr:transferring glycosyl group transferase [Actinidia rufa]